MRAERIRRLQADMSVYSIIPVGRTEWASKCVIWMLEIRRPQEADCNSRCLPCADQKEARTNTHAYHKPLCPRAQCTPTHLVRWSRPLQHTPHSSPSWVRLPQSVSAHSTNHLQTRQMSSKSSVAACSAERMHGSH